MKLKRLTPHEIIEKLSGNISELLAERQSLKAHAVEVLGDQLAKADFDVHYDSVDFRYPHGLRTAHMTEKERNQFIKEARALLGWEE